MLSTPEMYSGLWNKKPQCLSEEDVFNHKRAMTKINLQEKPETFAALETIKTAADQTGKSPAEEKRELHESKPAKSTRKFYNFEVHGKQLKLAAMSCLLCSERSFVRRAFVWIVFWDYTNAILHSLIVINAIFLGLYDYTIEPDATPLNNACYNLLLAFRLLFVVEAIVKIIAVGLAFTAKSYLRDPWNLLDFSVVLSICIFNAIDSTLNLTMFRLIRLLSLIQHSNRSTTIKQIVASLIKKGYQIMFVLFLLFLIILIFSLVGMASFAGATHFFCRTTPAPVYGVWHVSPNDTLTCGGSHTCDENTTCGSLYEVLKIPGNGSVEINYGNTNYDSIFKALVTTFQVSTKEGWSKIMYTMGNAYSLWVSGIFYGLCIIMGGYFAFGLFVPILQDSFFNTLLQIKPDSKIQFLKKLTTLLRNPAKDKKVSRIHTFKTIKDRIMENFSLTIVETTGEPKETLRDKLGWLLSTPIFHTFISVSIIVNNCILATDFYDKSKGESSNENMLATSYFVFLGLFVLEMVLRVIVNPKFLFNSVAELCDFLIVAAAVIECLVPFQRGCLLALRTFRIFIYAKLGKGVARLVNIVGKAIQALCLQFLIVFIFLYIYAVLGMQLFAGKLRFDEHYQLDLTNGTVPRANFDSLFWALFTSYQGFLGDNWHDAMYLSVKAVGWKCAFYYYTIILIGNITLASMFLGILLSLFMQEKVTLEVDNQTRRKSSPFETPYTWRPPRIFPVKKVDTTPVCTEAPMLDGERSERNKEEVSKEGNYLDIKEDPPVPLTLRVDLTANNGQMQSTPRDTENDGSPKETPRPLVELREDTKTERTTPAEDTNMNDNVVILNSAIEESENTDSESEGFVSSVYKFIKRSSLFIFHKNWAIRKWLAEWVVPFDEEIYYLQSEYLEDVKITDAYQRMKSQPKARQSVLKTLESQKVMQRKRKANTFEFVILTLILLSILVLIIDDPLKDPNSPLRLFTKVCNIIFTCAFALEALLKIIAMDFIWPSDPQTSVYLSSGWNILDLAVVITSIIDLFNITQYSILKTLKVFRALRALRPMKMMRHNEQLCVIVNSLISVLPKVAVLIILISFYLFSFGIVTTFYFKGTLYTCDQPGIDTEEDCYEAGGSWVKSSTLSFDKITWSMVNLLQAMLKNGWSQIAYTMIDARGIGISPSRDHQPAWGVFLIFFVLFGYLLLSEMILCVLFECFYTAKLELCGALTCNLEEQQWINMQRFMLRRDLKIQMAMPDAGIRRKCYKMATERTIEIIDFAVLIIGPILYSVKYYMMPRTEYWILTVLTYFCAIELNVYCGIKFLGFGKVYLQDNWNLLDLFALACCDFGIPLELSNTTPILFSIGIAIRLFKIIKYLRDMKNSKINVIVDGVLFILPSLLNVCILLFLLLMIYAILGIHLFWNVKFQGSINENKNFRSFGNAILLVLSCATGEDWNGIMHSLAFVEGQCTYNQSFEDIQINGIRGCGTSLAYPYFITFIIFVYLIGMKLFTVVVIEGYMEAVNENYSIITAKDFDTFLENWAIYDPSGTGWISFEGLVYLFFSLDPPLGVYDKKVRGKLWNNYRKKAKIVIVRNKLIKTLINQIDLNEEFMLHKNEISVFERQKVLKLLKELQVPLEVGTWRVHYRDICQRMAIRAIRAKNKDNFEYI